jgi:shikimate kinase
MNLFINNTQHIVLIGFKHVGKSIIGKHLAKQCEIPYFDLNKQVEQLYSSTFTKALYKEILDLHGEPFFRRLESDALAQAVNAKPSILSIGEGTLLTSTNQKLIESSTIIHITAPEGIVFERILTSGRPAFLKDNENLVEAFKRLWNERNKIYERISHFSIVNKGSIEDAINQILLQLAPEEIAL